MKINNQYGFSHHLVLLGLVLLVAVGGTFTLVGSHASSASSIHITADPKIVVAKIDRNGKQSNGTSSTISWTSAGLSQCNASVSVATDYGDGLWKNTMWGGQTASNGKKEVFISPRKSDQPAFGWHRFYLACKNRHNKTVKAYTKVCVSTKPNVCTSRKPTVVNYVSGDVLYFLQ
jgi:hypothetical protein